MSTERMDELEQRLTVLDKIVKLGWALIVGSFAIGGWVAVLELRTQASAHSVEVLQRAHSELSLEVMGTHNQHDKRITRIEDAILLTSKSLDRIEDKLQTAPK